MPAVSLDAPSGRYPHILLTGVMSGNVPVVLQHAMGRTSVCMPSQRKENNMF